MIERRKDPRFGIEYPVYFVSLGEDGNEKNQDFAVVVNISGSGVLIESTVPILTQQIKIMASLKNKDTIEVFAELIYSMRLAEDKYRSGLSFKGDPDQINRFVSGLGRLANG